MAVKSNTSGSIATTVVQENFDHLSDARRKPPKSECVYRIGPAPREDLKNAAENAADIGTLDSDLEEAKENKYNKKQSRKDAGSRALIIYFAKMAKKTNKECVDYRFLESLFLGGANVNVNDKHGQTVLHEVARNWNTDLAQFFIQHRADINKADKLGRTPLHLAAAVNHYEMVEYLIDQGANLHAKTTGELQSPIHYAAKYNAVGSLKVLIEKRALINDRDYKKRTPIFLAAEMAREDAARYLVEIGVPVGVFDDTGMSCIALMIEKMPHIAVDALNQFLVTDTAFRKDYFYLNYLEENPTKWRLDNLTTDIHGVPLVKDKSQIKAGKRERQLACPTTALKLAVQLEEFDVIMHPVMQQLIKEKWNLFGKSRAIIGASIHFTYIAIWTLLAIFLPRDDVYYGKGNEWKIFLEILGVVLTLYFIMKQIWESKISIKAEQHFRVWRRRQLNRDMEYCHPRWKQEKTFLQSEMKANRSRRGGFLSDPWNIMDVITYISILIVIITRVYHLVHTNEGKSTSVNNNSTANSSFTNMSMARATTTLPPVYTSANDGVHLRAYTVALIFLWLHFMKSCRPFTSLGPFITMLGHMISDTITFMFLFFEFFIPYAVGFWILFGGPTHAAMMEEADEDPIDWEKFNDLLFSVWQVTLNVDFNFGALAAVNRVMAQVMIGTFFTVSTVLCLNLYIALLSETFSRVYQNATANASLLQANTIIQLEHTLTKKKLKQVVNHIQVECGPLVKPQPGDEAGITEEELWDKTVRNVLGRFDTLYDFLKERFKVHSKTTGSSGPGPRRKANSMDNLLLQLQYQEEQQAYDLYQVLLQRDKELYQIQYGVYELKCALLNYLGEPLPPPPQYKPLPPVNIQPPIKLSLPAFPQRAARRQQRKNTGKNNAIFRSIMENKADEYQYDENDFVDDDDELSDSWEDIPMTEVGESLAPESGEEEREA